MANNQSKNKLLSQLTKWDLNWIINQGYAWFHETYMPTLEKAASSSQISKEKISDFYYNSGDVADLTNAPNKALEYYHKALDFAPNCSATYREIALIMESLGRNDEALEYSDKALALDPDDDNAVNDRESYFLEGEPFYKESDVLWGVCECLANRECDKALAIVKDMNDEIGLRGKSYCYGALGDAEKYLETWLTLTQISGEIFLGHTDWFYIPEDLFSGSDFWTLLLSSQTEFSGFGIFYESLENNAAYKALSTNEKMRLSFLYLKHARSKNYDALRELLKIYPEWQDVDEFLSESNHPKNLGIIG